MAQPCLSVDMALDTASTDGQDPARRGQVTQQTKQQAQPREDQEHKELDTSFSSSCSSTVPSEGENTLAFLLQNNLQANSASAITKHTGPPYAPATGAQGGQLSPAAAPAPARAQVGRTTARGMPVHYLPTARVYDEWASVYDNDGNVLQAVDDVELERALPALLDLLAKPSGGATRIVDFGCGTGRNTVKLLLLLSLRQNRPGVSAGGVGGTGKGTRVEITGYDASRGMVEIAQQKLDAACQENPAAAERIGYQLIQHDFLDPTDPFRAPVFFTPRAPDEAETEGADAVVSTLVLEHFPLRTYFQAIHGLLRRNGVALVTNMHPEMGAVSQAGFERIDAATGVVTKVRGCSWAHGVSESVDMAQECGFEVVEGFFEGCKGGWKETAVSREMIERGQIGARGRKWVGTKVWYGMLLRRR